MKSNAMKFITVSLIGLFSIFNVYQFQIKNKRFMNEYNMFLQTQVFFNGIAYGEDFPEDPNKGENLGEYKYEERKVLQYYEYLYVNLYKEENGEQVYAGYKIPTTQVVCKGVGNVNCYKGIYAGWREYLGEVKESERKDK